VTTIDVMLDSSLAPAETLRAAHDLSHRRAKVSPAVRKTFGRRPKEVRRSSEKTRDRLVSVSLPYRPPLDWRRMIEFLQARATPGVEVVSHDRYRRAIEIGGELGEIELAAVPDKPWLALRISIPSAAQPGLLRHLTSRARRIFDLDADSVRIGADLKRSKILAPLVCARPGLRVPGAWDPFELAVRAILGQQISVRAATTLSGRLAAAFGQPLEGDNGGLTHSFPKAEQLTTADLRAIGATGAQERAIRALSNAVCKGELELDASRGLDDFAERFSALPGIGPWTTQYVAMRALAERDAFPAGDLGLRRALGERDQPISAKASERISENWRPWRAYAALYLWTSPGVARARAKR